MYTVSRVRIAYKGDVSGEGQKKEFHTIMKRQTAEELCRGVLDYGLDERDIRTFLQQLFEDRCESFDPVFFSKEKVSEDALKFLERYIPISLGDFESVCINLRNIPSPFKYYELPRNVYYLVDQEVGTMSDVISGLESSINLLKKDIKTVKKLEKSPVAGIERCWYRNSVKSMEDKISATENIISFLSTNEMRKYLDQTV